MDRLRVAPVGHNRRAKFYTLSARGRQQLRAEAASWSRFVNAVAKVMSATEQPV